MRINGNSIWRAFKLKCSAFKAERQAVTGIEYGILAALIILAILGAVTAAGANANSIFGLIGQGIQGTPPVTSDLTITTSGECTPDEYPASFMPSCLADSNGALVIWDMNNFGMPVVPYPGDPNNPDMQGEVPSLSDIENYLTEYPGSTTTPADADPANSWIGAALSIFAENGPMVVPGMDGTSKGAFILPEGTEFDDWTTGSAGGFWDVQQTGSSAFTSANINSITSACNADGGSISTGTSSMGTAMLSCNTSGVYKDAAVAAAMDKTDKSTT
jgi:Flp pilus assembly pilin Flp